MTVIRPAYVGETELPYPTGTHPGATVYGDVDPAGRAATWTLSGIEPDHRFYSADLLQAVDGRHPVDIYWAENNLPAAEAPYRLVLDWVLLAGLPEPARRTLYACPKHRAKGLFDFLNKVSYGRNGQAVWDVTHQLVRVVDRRLLATLTVAPPVPPTVPVSLFGLTGPGGTYAWQISPNPLQTDPRLVLIPPAHQVPVGRPKPRRPFT